MINLLLLLSCHFIGDFPFQGDWISANKGKSWEILFYHCAIYVATFIIFGYIGWRFALVLFVSHFIIDTMKARWKIIKPIWIDQILHFAIILICMITFY